MSTTTSAGHAAGMAGLATPTPAYRRHAWAAVLALVAFLAGDGGAYITGQCIHVDGGMVMA